MLSWKHQTSSYRLQAKGQIFPWAVVKIEASKLHIYICFPEEQLRIHEMAQSLKAHAAKTGNLSSRPRIYRKEGKKWPLQVVLWPPYARGMCMHVDLICGHSYIDAHTKINQSERNEGRERGEKEGRKEDQANSHVLCLLLAESLFTLF